MEKYDNNKNVSQDPVYEQLGFKHNLKFGARSDLRDACKKFLRFAFLLDFIALESLSNVFLHSIRECIEKLKLQVHTKDPKKAKEGNYELEASRADLHGQNLTGQRGKPESALSGRG